MSGRALQPPFRSIVEKMVEPRDDLEPNPSIASNAVIDLFAAGLALVELLVSIAQI
jgi:hypothetical protein